MIRFATKLGNVERTPDLILRLRVNDELAFVSNPAGDAVSCQTPNSNEHDYYIPVKAGSDSIYVPDSSASVTVPSGVTLAAVNANGWVSLPGLSINRYYTFTLKGPKTRATRMAQHTQLQLGTASGQNFDWAGTLLMPGDLPDPNNSNLQDCTINSFDLSFIINRIGSTDQTALDIADVNYDNVVNGNDLAQVVNTLSTKQDDD